MLSQETTCLCISAQVRRLVVSVWAQQLIAVTCSNYMMHMVAAPKWFACLLHLMQIHLVQHARLELLLCDTSWIVSQGAYSHSLAEWALTACSWFAKDLPRLKRQQKDKNWEPYYVEELRLVAYPAAANRIDQCCQHVCLICAFAWPSLVSDLHFCVAVSLVLEESI